MKETRFIAQNKEKWQESENLLNDSNKDPEKLSNLFIQVVDDLSYSRTYYPNRSVRVYLNKIAREYFSYIYSHKREKKNTFKQFWLNDLPQIVYYCRKPLMLSLLIFLVSASIGIFSSIKDPQFASTILGENYIAMTKENIKKGDPMAVYKQGHQVDMFLGITLNNLMVAFRTYVFGIFMSIGTVAILLYNGIMVGCFQFFFIERGLLAESALTIWLHGTLEISSIILAGGAGLTLGSGLLFPGTYSRLQAFQLSGVRSLKLMLGITPLFVLAAIIESFLTRYTDVPDFLRLLLILLSACFIIGYFVVFPWVKARKGFDYPLIETKLPPSIIEKVHYDKIKGNAEIIKDAFIFYKKYINTLLPWIALVTLLMTAAEIFLTDQRTPVRMFTTPFVSFLSDLYYALNTPHPVFILINTTGFTLILYRVYMLLDAEAKNTVPKKLVWKSFLQTVFVVAVIFSILYASGNWGVLLVVLMFAMFILVIFTQLTEETYLPKAISHVWQLSAESFSNVMGLQFILLLLSFSFLIILSAPLLYINTDVLGWNFAPSDVWAKKIIVFIEIFIKIFAFNLVLPIIATSVAHLYFSANEIFSAAHLKKSILQVGTKLSKTDKR